MALGADLRQAAHACGHRGSTAPGLLEKSPCTQRPCAAQIVYEVHADSTYRLNASGSSCDEKYKSTQQKLYAKTRWKLEGDKFTTSATNFAVGQSYTVSVSGNRMTWVGTEGQGTLILQKQSP
ncbi:hypothetical protein [Methylibium sp.]|uniref:hypothetical protein n=1 Tax=Methylibium sp. TaxID=2067992 RepID=UPI003BA9501A